MRQVQLLQRCSAIVDRSTRDNLQAVQQRFRFTASVRLHYTDDNIDIVPVPRACCGQHLECLADARRRAEKDFKSTMCPLLRGLQQRIR